MRRHGKVKRGLRTAQPGGPITVRWMNKPDEIEAMVADRTATGDAETSTVLGSLNGDADAVDDAAPGQDNG